jgi:hypothetical protein
LRPAQAVVDAGNDAEAIQSRLEAHVSHGLDLEQDWLPRFDRLHRPLDAANPLPEVSPVSALPGVA